MHQKHPPANVACAFPGAGAAARAGVVAVIPSSQIIINGGKYTTSINVNQMQAESGASYAISLCPNGTEQNDPNLAPNTVLGNCIADQSRMTLQ